MGCFKKNGFYSHLPISVNDDIVLFIFADESRLYSTDMNAISMSGTGFTPISVPFFGKYNDYGGIMNVVDDANSRRFNYFTGVSVEEFVDLLITADGVTIGELIEKTDDEESVRLLEIFDRLSHSGRKKELSFVFSMEHRSIYDKMVSLGRDGFNPPFSSILRATPEQLFDNTDIFMQFINKASEGEYKGINPLKLGVSYTSKDIIDAMCRRGLFKLSDDVKETLQKSDNGEESLLFLGGAMFTGESRNYSLKEYIIYSGMTDVDGFREIFSNYAYFLISMRKTCATFAMSTYHNQFIDYKTLIPIYEEMLNVIKQKYEQERRKD